MFKVFQLLRIILKVFSGFWDLLSTSITEDRLNYSFWVADDFKYIIFCRDEDTEISSAKLDSFCQYQYGKDVHSIDITSDQFKSLPAEIRHDILSELQETRKQSSWARIHEMPEVNFSFFEKLMKKIF